MRKILATVLGVSLCLTLTPAVFAEGVNGENESAPSYEVNGGITGEFVQKGAKRKTKDTPTCTGNDCISSEITYTVTPSDSFTQTVWFDDSNTYYAPSPDGNTFPFNFDSLNILSKTSLPKADIGLGYNGNAIPLNQDGSFVIKGFLTVNTFDNVETEFIYSLVIDPVTGSVSQELAGENEWVTKSFEYKVGVSSLASPALQTRFCSTFGEYQLNGPFQKNGQPMKSVLEGGTMTRTPLNDGVIGWEGRTVEQPSRLGSLMTAPKTGTPSPGDVFANCVPSQDSVFTKTTTDRVSDLGRYVAPTQIWASRVDFYHFSMSQALIQRVFPQTYTSASTSQMYRYVSGIGYVLNSINGAAPLKPYNGYYKIVCSDGTKVNKRSQFTTVNQESYEGFDAQNWNDETTDYYSWDCSAGNGYTTERAVLQCDRYDGTELASKGAAPLLAVTKLVGNEEQIIIKEGDVYRISSSADPIHAEWERVRINTSTGQNILASNKVANTVWEFQYEIADDSSPMLLNTPVNDSTQPYHGWVDSSADTVNENEMPATRTWEPGKYYAYDILPASHSTTPYTYTTKIDLSPYTYRSETRQTGSYSYPCGTYTYQSGTETYQCGGGYSVVSSGGATYYWWVNGGRGGWACPGGWWLSGTTCFTNTYIPPQSCSRPTFATGTNYCSAPTYGTFSVKNAPTAGWFDNGSQYQRNTQIKNPAPAGYTDNGVNWMKMNPAPAGYTTVNDTYVSNQKVNKTGQMGGIEFNTFRPGVSETDTCVMNPSRYTGVNGESFTIDCGDNVTEETRSAYLRYFMSTSQGRDFTITPLTKVTADVFTTYGALNGLTMDAGGRLTAESVEVQGWVRESVVCPSEPINIVIERVAS